MSNMTRAIRLSMPHPLADLKMLADNVFAAATPAGSQSMHFNYTVLEGDLFRMECEYDPSEPWPTDFVALQLAAWRTALAFQRLEVTLLGVWSLFARFAAAWRDVAPAQFCDRHPQGTPAMCAACANARIIAPRGLAQGQLVTIGGRPW
ncbi:hypothetical protein [Mycolicibacterium mucogenicum]|uniref:Uncharacterized protein n=1 Tax=Mycolicibacterium mucogenicum DSM 44124 TaxID=1226753 RepID=A0A8H2PJV6_MYCMU|nr:hypothetical protein [Mycolicibacterium mucogenicum]KAB7753693.1 hypothetical protein MMUC44124_24140 [Mycolicibacterium mucogenicum DSM 44124]QPG68917.1 hypothetical protein C1S78_026455 [Mycolicibacterium mucogenicum DSM 44124]